MIGCRSLRTILSVEDGMPSEATLGMCGSMCRWWHTEDANLLFLLLEILRPNHTAYRASTYSRFQKSNPTLLQCLSILSVPKTWKSPSLLGEYHYLPLSQYRRHGGMATSFVLIYCLISSFTSAWKTRGGRDKIVASHLLESLWWTEHSLTAAVISDLPRERLTTKISLCGSHINEYSCRWDHTDYVLVRWSSVTAHFRTRLRCLRMSKPVQSYPKDGTVVSMTIKRSKLGLAAVAIATRSFLCVRRPSLLLRTLLRCYPLSAPTPITPHRHNKNLRLPLPTRSAMHP